MLHAINLLGYWANTILIVLLGKSLRKSPQQTLLASILYAAFPFTFLAVPWITAMPHSLVTFLTLLAAYAALEAERTGNRWWWSVSLIATALAPFAHESGVVCATIVGGLVFLKRRFRLNKQSVVPVTIGGLLNVGAILLRSCIPGVNNVRLLNPSAWLPNSMFFLHGLLYPFGPLIGWLVREWGLNDFLLIGIGATAFGTAIAWLVHRRQQWRWLMSGLWW